MSKYRITKELREFEELAREVGYYSRYTEGCRGDNSDILALRANEVCITIKDRGADPGIKRQFYCNIKYKDYSYIGMYNRDEVIEMLKGVWKYTWGYIRDHFEK